MEPLKERLAMDMRQKIELRRQKMELLKQEDEQFNEKMTRLASRQEVI